MKNIFFSLLLLFIIFSSESSAIDNSLPKGAAIMLHVKAKDLDRYITEITNNSEALSAAGAVAGGYCIVKSGNNYPGEVSVWQYFLSMGDLMSSIDKTDHMNEPQTNISKMRDLQYISIWKDMKEVNIKPGFEMVEKWRVPANNQEDFVAAVTALETNLKEISGIDFEMGVAFNLGSGIKETDLIMTRWITSDGETMGKLLDTVYNSVGFLPSYNKALKLAQKVNSQIEECKAIYVQ